MSSPDGDPTVVPLVPASRRARATASAVPVLRRDPLMWILALMVLTYIWRVQDLFRVIGRFSPALVATGVGLLLWFFDRDPRRQFRYVLTPTMKLILTLVAFMLFSVPTSLWPGNSVAFLSQDFGLTFLFMMMVAISIRGLRDVEWFAMLNVIGAALYSIVVLLKHKVTSDGRLSGLAYYDANDLGLVLVCTLPLTVYFLRNAVKPWTRIIGLACFTVVMLTIVKTGSRGAFLGLIATMGYIVFQYQAIKKSTRIGAAVAGVLIVAAVGSEAYWTRIQTLVRPEEDYNVSENNLSGRMAIWKRGVGYMAQRPIFGVGVRCFSQAEGMLSSVGVSRAQSAQGFKWSVAHNSFVEVGAELGIIALAIFIATLVRSMRLMKRLQRRAATMGDVSAADAALAQALIGSLLGYMVSGFFLSQGYSAYLYTLLGMVVGMTKIHARVLAPAATPLRPGQRVRAVPPADGVAVARLRNVRP